MKNKKRAVVAGHICIDITPEFPASANSLELLTPGKLIHTEGIDIHTGGAVANTGLAMKLLGADVTLMGKIGKDNLGTLILDILGKYRSQDGMIIEENAQSSYSVVLALPNVDRIFLHNPGANDTFTPEDLDMETIQKADLFHFGYPTLMRQMYEQEGALLEKMVKEIHEAGVSVSLDMAAVDASSDAGKADWYKILEKIMPYVDFFVPSAEELCYMIDPPRYQEWMRRASGGDVTGCLTEADLAPLGEKIIAMGAAVVLIKSGAAGMYYQTADNEKLLGMCRRLDLVPEEWSGMQGFEYSYLADKVVSGTGAGDTSIAAFLASVLEGKSLSRSLQMATAEGASCVTAFDALSGLKSLEELEEKIRNGWKKVRK